MTPAIEEIVSLVDSSAVQLMRFLYCDTSGIIRGKATHTSKLRERMTSGIGLVKGMMAMNLLDDLQYDTALGATGEVRLIPDPTTFTILPYAPGSAAMFCDLLELDHRPWDLCPRSILKRTLERSSSAGITFKAAFEPEFTLAHADGGRFAPIDQGLCFSTESMSRAAGFISSFVETLVQQGIEVEQYYPELGHGQHELSIRFAPAMSAADRQLIYRETLRGVAYQKSLVASLAPKPIADQAGNGCHLHLSGWQNNTNKNLFWSGEGLSQTGRHFVAGILQHLPGLVALTCPSVNSYRRLKPKSWSSAYTCWGVENREAAVRIPSLYWDHEQESCNMELKCVDSSCNPYLALAAVIAAGLDGIERKLEPGDPVEGDPSELTPEYRHKHHIARLPETLGAALDELEKDSFLIDVLGAQMAKVFLIVKRSECAAFAKETDEFELLHHRTKF